MNISKPGITLSDSLFLIMPQDNNVLSSRIYYKKLSFSQGKPASTCSARWYSIKMSASAVVPAIS